MNPRDTSGCSQNPSQITKSRRLGESKSRRPFFRSLLGTSRDLEQRAETWRPWRAYAAMYLWRIGSQCVPRENKLVSRKPQKRTVETTISHQQASMVV